MKLPAVLFSGEFSSRHDDDIHEHSGFIVLDFDHVEVETINESRACFESYDPELFQNQLCEKFSMLLSEEGLNAKPEAPTLSHTDYGKLNVAARMVRSAADGEKHNVLIKAATLCGGYIAAGRLEEEEVVRVLSREIEKRDIDSLEQAIKDIRQGIDHGKTRPIRDTVQEEEEALRTETFLSLAKTTVTSRGYKRTARAGSRTDWIRAVKS